MESKLFPPTILCLGIQATRPFLLCFWCCTSSSNANNYKCEMLSESCCLFFSSQSLPILLSYLLIAALPTAFRQAGGDSWYTQVALTHHYSPHLLLLRQCLYFAPVLVWQIWHNCSWSLVRVCSEAHNNYSDVLYECLVTQIWDGAAVLGPKLSLVFKYHL